MLLSNPVIQPIHVIPLSTTIDLATVEALVEFLELEQSQLEVTETRDGIAAGSTLGQVRKENQDRYLVVRYAHPESGRNFFLAAIADGVGSLPQSGLSASTAIAVFVSALTTEIERLASSSAQPSWERLLRDAVQHANRYVYGKTGERGASTLSVVVVPSKHPACAVQIGDSKIFGLSKDFRFTQLSIDQTVGSHLVSLGVPHGSAAGRDPRFDRALAQYIGMADAVEPQFVVLERKWESILIATDGIAAVRKVLLEEGWNLISQQAKSRADFVRKILYLCNWFGGTDNSTLVIFPLSEQIMSIAARRDSSVLSAVTGSRTIELRVRSITAPSFVPTSSASDRKRQKAGKFRRGQKDRTQDPNSTEADGKSNPKSAPSITFLPGLAKNEHELSNPGPV